MSPPSLAASPAPAATPWLPNHTHQPEARLRLFCFPHAGGAASAYRTWARAFGVDVQVCAVEYPGRWSRHREAPFARVDQLVDAALVGMRAHWKGRFAFFGYSFGALVAFELARALRRRQLPGPERLFVGARSAPQLPLRHAPIHRYPDSTFVDAVGSRYGTLPAVVREDPDMLKLVLPSLRADMTAFETYTYQPEAPLDCPIVAMTGSEDRLIDPSDLRAWSAQTSVSFADYSVPGGHFFIQSQHDQVVNLVQRHLRAADGIIAA